MASAESVALADQKRILRRAMGDTRSRLTPEERALASRAATERLGALPELRAAVARGACVAGFVATRAEIDPAAALAEIRAGGARVALPRVSEPAEDGLPAGRGRGAGGSGAMGDARGDVRGDARADGSQRLTFHLASGGDLRPGRFGIDEPDASCPEVQAGDVAVMIVPGLAFDGAGRRLGFGGGYYDGVLAPEGGRRPLFVVGLGYDFQIVATCPADGRDARVDCVVTDTRVIRCTGMDPGDRGLGGAGEVGL